MLANFAGEVFNHVPRVAAWMVQEGGQVGWDPISLWKQMGIIAKIVVVILFIMSGWSIGVMIDRAMAYNAARKQSRAFAPAVAGALRLRPVADLGRKSDDFDGAVLPGIIAVSGRRAIVG